MRLIDADEYAAKMHKRQVECDKWMASTNDEVMYARGQSAAVMLIESKLTLDKMPTIDAVSVDWIRAYIRTLKAGGDMHGAAEIGTMLEKYRSEQDES